MNVTIFLTLKVFLMKTFVVLNGFWIIELETVFKQKIRIESDVNFSQKDQTRFSNLVFLKLENLGS